MTRPPITLTAAEWASVQPDGTLWLVREGEPCPKCQNTGTLYTRSGINDWDAEDCNCPPVPPAVFVQACAPCWMCGSRHEFPAIVGMRGPMPCPDCRIELVGPCRNPQCCNAARSLPLDCGWCRSTMHANGTVTLGHAYAIGQPLPIQHGDTPFNPDPAEAIHVARVNGRWKVGYRKGTTIYTITDRLAHYGLPETLVGRWAIQLRVVQP